MSWWEALLLGVIQGLTEFLPVSSSGHLEIGQALLGTSGEENLTFAIVVHTATVLSTLVILWKEVAQIFKGSFTTLKWNEDKNYVAMILVSMIPVFVVGMFFKEQVEAFFGSGKVVENPNLANISNYMAENGYKHHISITYGNCSEIIKEAFEKYLDYEIDLM